MDNQPVNYEKIARESFLKSVQDKYKELVTVLHSLPFESHQLHQGYVMLDHGLFYIEKMIANVPFNMNLSKQNGQVSDNTITHDVHLTGEENDAA